jgi:hypothetical protein
MTLDEAHKIVLSYPTTNRNDDWLEAIAQIKEARLDAAFEKVFEDDQAVSRGNAKYYFDKGVEYANATD